MIVSGLRKNQAAAFIAALFDNASLIVYGKTLNCCLVDMRRELSHLEFESEDGIKMPLVAAYCPRCKAVRWWDE